jgi:hypothetical protein
VVKREETRQLHKEVLMRSKKRFPANGQVLLLLEAQRLLFKDMEMLATT